MRPKAAEGPGSALRDRLAEGSRGEVGAAATIANEIADYPILLDQVVLLLDDDDPAVVAHAAHALMQVSRDRADLFNPHVEKLLTLLEGSESWEIGEQLPKVLAGCALSPTQAGRLAIVLERNLSGRSNIAAASALSGIADLAEKGLIRDDVFDAAIDTALKSPKKALAARARRLRREA